MRRLFGMLALCLLMASSMLAQNYPEVDALIDGLFAKDLNGVLAHLPPEVGKAVKNMPERQRLVMAQMLPLVSIATREGLKITRADGSGAALTIEKVPRPGRPDPDDNLRVEIFVEKRLTDGTETLLRLRLKVSGTPEKEDDHVGTVNLRFVDGEWRLYEIQADREVIKLDDPGLLGGFHVTNGPPAAEASAVGALRTYNTALVTYAATYPEIGYPRSPEQLGGTGGTADQAGLVDEALSTSPFEKNGYRFSYRPENNAAYTVVARPVNYADGSKRSFFTDQSGVIRFTAEDRDPTADDPPLQ